MATNKGAADLSPVINSARFSDVDIAFSLSGGRNYAGDARVVLNESAAARFLWKTVALTQAEIGPA
jgi:hypothetical protein